MLLLNKYWLIDWLISVATYLGDRSFPVSKCRPSTSGDRRRPSCSDDGLGWLSSVTGEWANTWRPWPARVWLGLLLWQTDWLTCLLCLWRLDNNWLTNTDWLCCHSSRLFQCRNRQHSSPRSHLAINYRLTWRVIDWLVDLSRLAVSLTTD